MMAPSHTELDKVASPELRIDYARQRADRYMRHMVAQIQAAGFIVASNAFIMSNALGKAASTAQPSDTIGRTVVAVSIVYSSASLVVCMYVTFIRTSDKSLQTLSPTSTSQNVVDQLDAYASDANNVINKRKNALLIAMLLFACSLIMTWLPAIA